MNIGNIITAWQGDPAQLETILLALASNQRVGQNQAPALQQSQAHPPVVVSAGTLPYTFEHVTDV